MLPEVVVGAGGVDLAVDAAGVVPGFGTDVVVGAGAGFALPEVVVGAGGVDLAVDAAGVVPGFGTDVVVGAGAGFVLPDVAAGAGGVDLAVGAAEAAAGLGTEVPTGLGTEVELAAGLNSGAAGAVLAGVPVSAAGVTLPGFGTDVVLTDVVPVGAVATGGLAEGTETAGFDCGAGGVDLPETVILGVTSGAAVAAGAAGFATLPEPADTDPLPELAEEPLPDGLGTELTLIGFRRMVPLAPPEPES